MLHPGVLIAAAVMTVAPSLWSYVANFFAGAFVVNCVPHLVTALQGKPFPSPFARPPGKGDSTPAVNFAWGSFNLLVGILLLVWRPVTMGFTGSFAALFAGFLVFGIQISLYFGKVRRERLSK